MPDRHERAPGNWVDPDIVAYYEKQGGMPVFDLELERGFKEFFETGWQDPQYDDLRPRWDPHINDVDPYGRVLAKTALWSVVSLREAQSKLRQKDNKPKQTNVI